MQKLAAAVWIVIILVFTGYLMPVIYTIAGFVVFLILLRIVKPSWFTKFTDWMLQ